VVSSLPIFLPWGGISVAQAQKELTTLAAVTAGYIAVPNDGELIFSCQEGDIPSTFARASNQFIGYELVQQVSVIFVHPGFIWCNVVHVVGCDL
jgi:hypothetical protein